MSGIAINVGNGFFSSTTHLGYQVSRDGLVLLTGVAWVASGSVVGFSDPLGFDVIRIGGYFSAADAAAAILNFDSEVNALALDRKARGRRRSA